MGFHNRCAVILWCGVFACLVPAAMGQQAEPEVLTLQQAESIALENHPGIRAARERIKVQEAVVGRAKAGYFPTLGARSTYENRPRPATPTAEQNVYKTTGEGGLAADRLRPPRGYDPPGRGHPGGAPFRPPDLDGGGGAHGAAGLLRLPPRAGPGPCGAGYRQGPGNPGAAGPGFLRCRDAPQDRRGAGGGQPLRGQGRPDRSPERGPDCVGAAEERHGRDPLRGAARGFRRPCPAVRVVPGTGGEGGVRIAHRAQGVPVPPRRSAGGHRRGQAGPHATATLRRAVRPVVAQRQ